MNELHKLIKQVLITITFMPLLQQQGYLSRRTVIVVLRVDSCERLLITFLPFEGTAHSSIITRSIKLPPTYLTSQTWISVSLDPHQKKMSFCSY